MAGTEEPCDGRGRQDVLMMRQMLKQIRSISGRADASDEVEDNRDLGPVGLLPAHLGSGALLVDNSSRRKGRKRRKEERDTKNSYICRCPCAQFLRQERRRHGRRKL